MDITRKSTQGLGIRMTLIFFMVGVWLMASMTPANAAKTTTVKATVTFSGPKTTLLPAGDDKAHMVGLGERTGAAVFSDGEKAKYSNVFFMDLYRGKSVSIWGYTKMVFKDGSWFFFKWDSKFTGRDKAGKPTFKGTGTILKGAGLYKGIQGTVKYQNRQIPPSNAHPKGATEAKAEFTYILP
jgi:hypothetical protein